MAKQAPCATYNINYYTCSLGTEIAQKYHKIKSTVL